MQLFCVSFKEKYYFLPSYVKKGNLINKTTDSKVYSIKVKDIDKLDSDMINEKVAAIE